VDFPTQANGGSLAPTILVFAGSWKNGVLSLYSFSGSSLTVMLSHHF
jgi:hypothetical protein